MDREKAEIYILIANLFYKGLFTLVLLVCLIAAMWKLMSTPNWPVSGVVAVLGYSFQQMARHFFPTTGPAPQGAIAGAPAQKELPPAT